MKVLTDGHKYVLANFDNPEGCQTVQFIEKVPVAPTGSKEEQAVQLGTLQTVNDGTTNEEVLKVLIDRLNYLQGKFPCKENAVALTHIETALLWLNYRTAKRQEQNVESKQVAHK